MSRPKSSRDPGKSKGPNAKEKRHRAKPANAKRKGSAAKKRRRSSGSKRAARRPDPSDVPGAEVRFIQPYDAVKGYVCPGCNRTIPPGLGHMVVVPPDDPDLRRHWHRGCWVNRPTL
ncbi:MAG: hypothetical protein R2733_15095 [Acidimicrobiales bacterium]